MVTDIDDVSHTEDIEVVFGVGIASSFGDHGYVGLDRWELIEDVLNGGDTFDPERVVRQALPRILVSGGNVPVFKYLRGAGLLKADGTLRKKANVSPKVERMADKTRSGLPSSANYARKASSFLSRIKSLKELEDSAGIEGVFNYGTLMKPKFVDPSELRDFLLRNPCSRQNSWNDTQWVKLVCFYDWLVYGRPE